MIAYRFIRFSEYPDIADIQSEGRASHIGRVRFEASREGEFKNYNRNPRSKKAIRRYLKGVNRRRDLAFEIAAGS